MESFSSKGHLLPELNNCLELRSVFLSSPFEDQSKTSPATFSAKNNRKDRRLKGASLNFVSLPISEKKKKGIFQLLGHVNKQSKVKHAKKVSFVGFSP